MSDTVGSESVILAEGHVLSPAPVAGVARRSRGDLLVSLAPRHSRTVVSGWPRCSSASCGSSTWSPSRLRIGTSSTRRGSCEPCCCSRTWVASWARGTTSCQHKSRTRWGRHTIWCDVVGDCAQASSSRAWASRRRTERKVDRATRVSIASSSTCPARPSGGR